MSSPTSVTLNNSNKSGNSNAPTDYQIRSKLLHKLGIYGAGRGSPPSDVTATPQAPPPTMHSAPLSAAQIRRDRILRGMGVGYTLKSLPPDGSAVRNPLQGVKPVTEPLKSTGASEESTTASSVSTSADSADAAPRRKTRIMFEEQVQVMPIPTRYEYSDRIKSRIWSNRHELQENAERNAVEFAAEGWNWRTVTEDDGTFQNMNSFSCMISIFLF